MQLVLLDLDRGHHFAELVVCSVFHMAHFSIFILR